MVLSLLINLALQSRTHKQASYLTVLSLLLRTRLKNARFQLVNVIYYSEAKNGEIEI